MTEKRDGFFAGKDGFRLYFQTYLPVGTPSVSLIIVHGAGDHCERYARAVHMFVPRGMAVFGFDQRGCGHSAGQRGHINAWDEYREDVRTYVEMVRLDQPGAPIFLWGYGNGALVAADYALDHPGGLAGLILMSAPFLPRRLGAPLRGVHPNPAARLAGKALSMTLPHLSTKRLPAIHKVTRDPEVIRAAAQDMQRHALASARWSEEVRAALRRVNERVGEFNLPILLLHGEDDQLYSPDGARRFYAQLPEIDKEIRVYRGGYHELHNDVIFEQVLVDMAEWMEERILTTECTENTEK